MSARVLEEASASTEAVLTRVTPDQLDGPTPCASWTVRDLVNHIVGGPAFFAVIAETGTMPDRGPRPDVTGGDFVALFRERADRAIAAFAAEGAMEKPMQAPMSVLPGGVFVYVAATDTFTHGWDLARATGQSTDLDPDLATRLLDASERAIRDDLRGPDGRAPFGPRVEPGADARPADTLAAFLGRSV